MRPEEHKQINTREQAIETALSPGGFMLYNAAWSFVHDAETVANEIDKIVERQPERAANLLKAFIAACHG